MKTLMDLLDRHDDQHAPSALAQIGYAVAGGASLALFFATIHLQAM